MHEICNIPLWNSSKRVCFCSPASDKAHAFSAAFHTYLNCRSASQAGIGNFNLKNAVHAAHIFYNTVREERELSIQLPRMCEVAIM